jgi:hypothetical protein
MMPSARPARPQHLRPPRPADDVGCRRAQNACTQHSERPPELEKVRRHVRIRVDLGAPRSYHLGVRDLTEVSSIQDQRTPPVMVPRLRASTKRNDKSKRFAHSFPMSGSRR